MLISEYIEGKTVQLMLQAGSDAQGRDLCAEYG